MFFNEVVGKKNKHKNRKAIWFEYRIIEKRIGSGKAIVLIGQDKLAKQL
jgi:methyl coenzyme M reductase subunit D